MNWQIENEYRHVEWEIGAPGKAYNKWAAQIAVGLGTGVPWVKCKQEDAPYPVVSYFFSPFPTFHKCFYVLCGFVAVLFLIKLLSCSVILSYVWLWLKCLMSCSILFMCRSETKTSEYTCYLCIHCSFYMTALVANGCCSFLHT